MSHHILWIAGPSGGGKSTFIRQLAAGTLAPEILALLPAACAHWPVIEANDVLKGDLSLTDTPPPPAPGWLVHYDIVFIHCHGIPRYEDDPAMQLLDAATSLGVVFIRPDGELLQRQFRARHAHQQQSKSPASRLWGRWVRRPLRRLLAPLTGKPVVTTAELYARDNWLAACYRQWETFCQHLMERQPQTSILTIEPVPGPHPTVEFRLRAHQPAPPACPPPSGT